VIDFKRNKDGVPSKVAAIEYDPNRSARIALLHYADGDKRYILAPKGLEVGNTITSGTGSTFARVAHLHWPTSRPVPWCTRGASAGKGAAIARSAGTSVQLMGKEGDYAILRMPSTEMRRVLLRCRATVGESAMPITATSRSAKQVAPATWAYARRCAELR